MTIEHDIANAPHPRASGVPQMLGVFDVMAGRTATRRFTGEPVDDATLDRLTTAMLAAPSASNKQAWAFVAVRDPARVRRIRAFAPGVIGVPPLLLVACFDGSRAPDDQRMPEVGVLCVAMAVQNLLLAAHALGLGGCPVSSFLAEPVRRMAGLPGHIAPVLVVPIGHPDREPQRSVRRDNSEVVRYEHW
ncbi:nitroreductase family protein [Saccharopolyspora sp. 6M]|uniref:nitroreductase family protein n=1 Tax=Saccharopolyspora sp. 6M TaxID=2877237 RepID=UPI001CD3CE5B|nr:nitroreductase family protein [Saccharopolyspora sp. 6M]MCA1226435.1 nitroreductase family protein [Saccharopolyspora sp. 6M]